MSPLLVCTTVHYWCVLQLTDRLWPAIMGLICSTENHALVKLMRAVQLPSTTIHRITARATFYYQSWPPSAYSSISLVSPYVYYYSVLLNLRISIPSVRTQIKSGMNSVNYTTTFLHTRRMIWFVLWFLNFDRVPYDDTFEFIHMHAPII